MIVNDVKWDEQHDMHLMFNGMVMQLHYITVLQEKNYKSPQAPSPPSVTTITLPHSPKH